MAQQPNPYRQQPVRRKPVQLNLPGASVTPAAQPVDTYYRTNAIAPRQSNEMLQLARALAPFSQSLGNYLSFEKDNMAKEATAQAEMDINEMSVEELKAVATMTPEELKANPQFQGNVASRPDYYIAAKLNLGKRLGEVAQDTLITRYGEMQGELTDPAGDPDINARLSDLRQELMEGFEGFYVQRGAAAVIDPQIDHLRKKTLEARQERVESENIENITVGLTKEYTSAFADGLLSSIEIATITAQTQAQLETYKATGGKDPQEIMFAALERAAIELVQDDPEGDEAAALLDKAEEMFGVGGNALAAPGTKAHARLITLRDDIEQRAEQNRNKDSKDYRSKVLIAEDKAGDVVSQFIMDNPDGSDLTPAVEEEIRNVFIAEGLDGTSASSFILNWRDESKKRSDVEDDMEVFKGFQGRLDDGEDISGELLDALGDTISKATFTRLNEQSKANRNSPEKKADQDEAWSIFTGNAIGADGIGAYTSESRTTLTNRLAAAKRAYRREATAARTSGEWNQFLDRWGPGGAAVTRFRAESEEALKFRKDRLPEFLMENPGPVKDQHRIFMKAFEAPEEGGTTLQNDLQAKAEDVWAGRMADAIAWAEDNSSRDSQIPSKIAQYMRNNAATMSTQVNMAISKGEEDAMRTGDLLGGIAGMTQDQFGETTKFELREAERLEERVVMVLSAKASRARGEGHNLDEALADLEKEVGDGGQMEQFKTALGSFVASKGRSATGAVIKEGTLRLRGAKYTTKEAKRLLTLLHSATGIDADNILSGTFPEGLTKDDIKVPTMRLFRDRAHFLEFEAEMKKVPKTDDGTLMAQTKIGKLVEALGFRPTTMDNKWTAQIIMQHQFHLLED